MHCHECQGNVPTLYKQTISGETRLNMIKLFASKF